MSEAKATAIVYGVLVALIFGMVVYCENKKDERLDRCLASSAKCEVDQ